MAAQEQHWETKLFKPQDYSDMLLVPVNTERKENGDVTRTLCGVGAMRSCTRAVSCMSTDRADLSWRRTVSEPKSESDRTRSRDGEILRRPWPEIWLDLNKEATQEMICMMAMDQLSRLDQPFDGHRLHVQFDAVKCADAERGEANLCHEKHGSRNGRAHSRRIEQFVEPGIVKSGTLLLAHARHPHDAPARVRCSRGL